MIRPPSGKAIDRKTRLQIKDVLLQPQFFWHGAQSEIEFLSELYDLEELPSNDFRFQTAYRDIKQHLDWNDWEETWVFTDPRL